MLHLFRSCIEKWALSELSNPFRAYKWVISQLNALQLTLWTSYHTVRWRLFDVWTRYLIYLMSTVRRVLSIQYSLALTFSNNTDINAWKSENTRNRETSKYIQYKITRTTMIIVLRIKCPVGIKLCEREHNVWAFTPRPS